MQVVLPSDMSIAQWVAEKLPDEAEFQPGDLSVGVAKDGKLVAAAVYSGHRPDYRNCEVSFASAGPGWASRRTVAALLSPPFREWGCQRVTALIRKPNKRSRRLVESLGFRLEGTLRRGFGDQSMCVYGLMNYEAEKWLERYNG